MRWGCLDARTAMRKTRLRAAGCRHRDGGPCVCTLTGLHREEEIADEGELAREHEEGGAARA